MFTAQNYIAPATLEEAWELNQNKNNKIIGGMLWLRLGHKNIANVIDLSGLNLDGIEETPEDFRIGAMCSLRTLEQHEGLESFFGGIIRQSVDSIVGTQFRNLATVGGSIFSRFGFSDILTALMALDSYVELYKGGLVSISQFSNMKYDRDIVVSIIIKKEKCENAYVSHRNTATDFPVLACAACRNQAGVWKIIYGARPGRAVEFPNSLPDVPSENHIAELADSVKDWEGFGTNMRGSAQYRKVLGVALLKKVILQITGKADI